METKSLLAMVVVVVTCCCYVFYVYGPSHGDSDPSLVKLNQHGNVNVNNANTESSPSAPKPNSSSSGATSRIVAPTPKDAARFIIYTRYRSGSSFVGALFGSHPDVYYFFEPLKLLAVDKKITKQFINQAATWVMQDILGCRLEHYARKAAAVSYEARSLIAEYQDGYECMIFNAGRIDICDDFETFENTEKRCRSKKYKATKVISMTTVNSLVDLLADGVKVIHLVRDPRSMWLSRIKVGTRDIPLEKYLQPIHTYSNMSRKDALGFGAFCQNLQDELQRVENFTSLGGAKSQNHEKTMKIFKQNYKMVRYEDVALSPNFWVKKMYHFLGLSLHQDVFDWIANNTHSDDDYRHWHSYSTRRNSTQVVHQWRRDLPFEYADAIQKACLQPMETLGYLPFSQPQDLTDNSLPFMLTRQQMDKSRLAEFLL